MKTIIARFTELKQNVAGTSESEFEDLDYNKVDKALKTVGISIKDATGQFRNLDDVFLELSSKWDTLDRNTQRYRTHSIFIKNIPLDWLTSTLIFDIITLELKNSKYF